MNILTYGYKQPQTGDLGSVFFPALEDVIAQVDLHDHDGSNSARLTSAASEVLTTSIPAGFWAADPGGGYVQTVTMPAALLFDEVAVQIKDTAGAVYWLRVEKLAANTFKVYCNDNTKNLVAVYAT